MSEGKVSTLNPLANSFFPCAMVETISYEMTEKMDKLTVEIPSESSELIEEINETTQLKPIGSIKDKMIETISNNISETNTIRGIAEAILKKVIEKEKNGEYFSPIEFANIVGELIVLKYKNCPDVDLSKLNTYLAEKILAKKTLLPVKLVSEDQIFCRVDKMKFDLSKFQPPKLSFLLVCFWGLYRHEQAERPLLSLPHRPEIVKDKVWSTESTDKLLWNRLSVKSVCQCPPMFGYTVPPSFFGNPFNMEYTCSEKNVHLNHYPESSEGNEFILTTNFNFCIPDEQPFIEDFDCQVDVKNDLDSLALQFENIVEGLLALLAKYDSNDCTEEEEDCGVEEIEDVTEDSICISESKIVDEKKTTKKAWDDFENPMAQLPIKQENIEDSDHPLLEAKDYEEDEEVSKEIEEMIRRSLSPKKTEHSQNPRVEFEDVEPLEVVCDPPCSVWCTNTGKDKVLEDQDLNKEGSKAASETASTEAVPNIDLLSPDDLNLAVESKMAAAIPAVDITPAQSISTNESPRRMFRRSLSVNDCDPYYYGARYDSLGIMSQASYSSELFKFKFSGKDALNYQSFNRSNSWKDTDSGFVSHHSSQEDLFDKDCREHDERGSMWGLFSGEDSLWKPLPECLTTRSDDRQVTHKRVRDLRRQRSLN